MLAVGQPAGTLHIGSGRDAGCLKMSACMSGSPVPTRTHLHVKRQQEQQTGRTAKRQRQSWQSPSGQATHRISAPGDSKQGSWWRITGLQLSASEDPGKDSSEACPALCQAVAARLGIKGGKQLPAESITVARKAYDARPRHRSWVYMVDVNAAAVQAAGGRLRTSPGVTRLAPEAPFRLMQPPQQDDLHELPHRRQDPVIVVGGGPAGLFAALEVASAGLPVILLERGQPVEVRGRDIGALMVRRHLNKDSNLCYGEGGAGTWSDGKLQTRIGKNSAPVRQVLQLLCAFGAPEGILVAGKPHLGTDKLVRILRAFRQHLQALSAQLRFGQCVTDLLVEADRVVGVQLADGQQLRASRVVLAVGHSSRAMYACLHRQGVAMTPKPFAMGFRIEHPQALIDRLQHGEELAAEVARGRGRIPVADYSLAADVLPDWSAAGPQTAAQAAASPDGTAAAADGAAAPAAGSAAAPAKRGVYSFCMCPGGQIVPTSTSPEELCLNGMSFSRRNSRWANAALVVAVTPADWAAHGCSPLAGVALQQHIERLAARQGGGNLTAPVQRVTDFMDGQLSQGQLPSSSYRLGVKSGSLHDTYAPELTAALRQALLQFNRRMPGFICPEGLLHGVETRTSSPVRIDRHASTLQSLSHGGLYPCAEGAGYAGGIVSAAVDGMKVGRAVVQDLVEA